MTDEYFEDELDEDEFICEKCGEQLIAEYSLCENHRYGRKLCTQCCRCHAPTEADILADLADEQYHYLKDIGETL